METFDEPSSPLQKRGTVGSGNTPNDNGENGYKKMLENILWKTVEKGQMERFTYQRYVSTARRMKGTKYALLVVKDRIGGNSVEAGELQVVGMAELGVTMNQSIRKDSLQPRATIGVLCVESKYRKLGIGKALVQRCETLVTDLWKDTVLYTEVEPINEKAISFFERCGYERCGGADETVMVTVSRRRRTEECEHFLFCKSLEPSPPVREDDYSMQ